METNFRRVKKAKIVVKGDNVMKGYWKQSESNRRNCKRRVVVHRRYGLFGQ